MTTKKEATPPEIYINNDLPILYVDNVSTRIREDGMNYLTFTTSTPNCVVEQVRLIIDEGCLHEIIDYLCRAHNYFPKKTSRTKRGPSK